MYITEEIQMHLLSFMKYSARYAIQCFLDSYC